MALVGLVRVSTSKQETQRQHDDLDPICVKVFEEKISGKLKVADRPDLRATLDYMRPGDILTVQARWTGEIAYSTVASSPWL
jgi:DNA invertase Pin-like site-specific DNA recombinase